METMTVNRVSTTLIHKDHIRLKFNLQDSPLKSKEQARHARIERYVLKFFIEAECDEDYYSLPFIEDTSDEKLEKLYVYVALPPRTEDYPLIRERVKEIWQVGTAHAEA